MPDDGARSSSTGSSPKKETSPDVPDCIFTREASEGSKFKFLSKMTAMVDKLVQTGRKIAVFCLCLTRY